MEDYRQPSLATDDGERSDPMEMMRQDPFLWLEEIDGADALAWVEAQNAATAEFLCDSLFEADKKVIFDILTAADRIPGVVQCGSYLYNFWTNHEHARGVWRRTSPASYRTATPQWDILLDLDALCLQERESWTWAGCTMSPPPHECCLIHLSLGGADAVVVREFDIGVRRFFADGFNVPEAKTSISWYDRDTVLIATSLGSARATASGYARTVRRWRRGEKLEDAKTVFEGKVSDLSVQIYRDYRAARTIFLRTVEAWNTELYIECDGKSIIRLAVPTDATIGLCADVLTIFLRSDWGSHRAGSLLFISLTAFVAGARELTTIFSPASRTSLGGWITLRDHVFLNILKDLRNEIFYAAASDNWEPRSIQGLPEHCTLSMSKLSIDDAIDDVEITATGFLTPTSIFVGHRDNTPELLKQDPAAFDASRCVVTRHDALAADGTAIPYFQVGPADPSHSFVRMYAYGGFGETILPSYMPVTGKLWLERGCIYVLACLRGGGEFGPDWHKAGQREGIRNAQDDLAAVAFDLISRGVTTAGRLSAEGSSNGGLLIGNMLTRHNTLFGAFVCEAPLLDMYRYDEMLAGASWVADYGNPKIPTDWAFLKEVSPYHLLEEGKRYPPVLFTTSRRDDRVHPGHARKMTAAMQKLGNVALFFEQPEGGHGNGVDSEQIAADTARLFAFIRHSLGITS